MIMMKGTKNNFKKQTFIFLICIAHISAVQSGSKKLSLCEGNCLTDEDCSDGLKCYFKKINNSNDDSPCDGKAQINLESYCVPWETTENVKRILNEDSSSGNPSENVSKPA